jgi:Zn-dependent protease with chaperone function
LADQELDWALTPHIRKRIIKKRKHTERLERTDNILFGLLEYPIFRGFWWIYKFLILLLSLPPLVVPYLLRISLVVVFIYAISLSSKPLIILTALVIFSYVLYQVLVYRQKTTSMSETLNREQAPRFFKMIEEITARIGSARVGQLMISLSGSAGLNARIIWSPFPHLEYRLGLPLISFFVLNENQLRAILAHELAHLRHRDAVLLMPLKNALRKLDEVLQLHSNETSKKLWPLLIFPYLYMKILAWIGWRVNRIQEYAADAVAAQTFGMDNVLEALITSAGAEIEFNDTLPWMVSQFRSGEDRHDFYTQFVRHWEKTSAENRQAAYAKAIFRLGCPPDYHISYKGRYRALHSNEEPIRFQAGYPPARRAIDLLPEPHELGKEITIKILNESRGSGWRSRE